MFRRISPFVLAISSLLMLVGDFPARAQDEVHLTDGGVLKGRIIKETETTVELKHPTFGVIQIPRERIVKMGPYGTLGTASPPATASDAGSAARARLPREGTARGGSRLDPDYQPPVFERPQIPDELKELEETARLEAEIDANPELAVLYEKLLKREVLGEEDAQKLFALNERWQADPESLTLLETRIVKALVGDSAADDEAPEPAAEQPRPPDAVAGLVDTIREKLAAVKEISYREVYSVTTPEGRIEIRYERQARPPNLTAGRGEVVEHVEPAQRGKAVRYFSDGESMWVLMRRGEGAGADSEAPRGQRMDEAAWAAAGLPIPELSRSRLLADPFASVDLSTLALEREDDAAWVFSARLKSAAFPPLETAELTVARETGLLQSLKASGGETEAELLILEPQVNRALPADTFRVPEAPAGQGFDLVGPPASASEALVLLGSR